MTYTEIKERNGKKYYYRVISIREGENVSKKREYLGVNLNKEELKQKEQEADKKLSNSNSQKQFEKKMDLFNKIIFKYENLNKNLNEVLLSSFLTDFLRLGLAAMIITRKSCAHGNYLSVISHWYLYGKDDEEKKVSHS